jgi:aminopeptidase N
VNVQEGYSAFMSADSTGNETINGRSIFYFSNQIPTSSYVIALVVGNLTFNMTEGSRNVGVISEPSMTEKSLKALNDLQKFLDGA